MRPVLLERHECFVFRGSGDLARLEVLAPAAGQRPWITTVVDDVHVEKIRLQTKAIRLNQRPISLQQTSDGDGFESIYDFFIFSLPSDVLLKVAKFLGRHESSRGVQRIHKEDRDKEIGKFICSGHPFFPNTIIINLPLGFEDLFYDESSTQTSRIRPRHSDRPLGRPPKVT